MSNSVCAGNSDLLKSVVPFGDILPYCSRPVAVAFAYALSSLISLETNEFPIMFCGIFIFGEGTSR